MWDFACEDCFLYQMSSDDFYPPDEWDWQERWGEV